MHCQWRTDSPAQGWNSRSPCRGNGSLMAVAHRYTVSPIAGDGRYRWAVAAMRVEEMYACAGLAGTKSVSMPLR